MVFQGQLPGPDNPEMLELLVFLVGLVVLG
jgi:hypothetical protein